MFFSWSPSADSFPGSRLGKGTSMPEVFINANIKNQFGLNCGEPIKEILTTDHNTLKNDISLPITRTCVNPSLSVSLVDQDGNVLDQQDFNVKTSTREKSPLNNMNIIIGVAILALIIVLIVVYLKNKKGKDEGGTNNPINIPVAMFTILFALVSVGINFPVFKTNAYLDAQWTVNGAGGGGGGSGSSSGTSSSGTTVVSTGTPTGYPPSGLAATFSIPLSSYDPNEDIPLTTNLQYVACGNATRDVVVTGHLEGISENLNYVGPTRTLFTTSITGLGDTIATKFSETVYIPAPPSKGDYHLVTKVEGYVPVEYIAEDNFTKVVIEKEFYYFKNIVVDYFQQYYQSVYERGDELSYITDTTEDEMLNQINSVLNNGTSMRVYKTGGDLAYSREYEISPVNVRGVNVTVNGSENLTITKGSPATVRWTATNPTYGCKCTLSPSINGSNSCGSSGQSSEDESFGSYEVDQVPANTTFTVSCKDFIQ